MQTVLTSITHTGFSVGLLYVTFLLKYKERRLDTIRNKILRTTFNFQRWNTHPVSRHSILNNEWTTQTNTGYI